MATLYLAPHSVLEKDSGGFIRNSGANPKPVSMSDEMAAAMMSDPRTAALFVDAPAAPKKTKKKTSKKKASKKKAVKKKAD